VLEFFREAKTPARQLDEKTEDFLSRFQETFISGKGYSANIYELFLKEAVFYLNSYIEFHKDIEKIEKRREDHWDVLNKKCSEDPMFQELWNQILVLMKLEQ
jgi:hypothetical protein